MLLRLAFVVTVAAAAASGCYNPSYKPGIACGAGDTCPSGLVCVGSICISPERIDAPQAPADSAVADAALPDAAPVGCQGDGDCLQPPDACSTPGTCNLGSHTCVFGTVDCMAMTDGCNDGVCNPAVGCVKQPAREGIDCGSGTTCTPFGACDYTGVCDSSAVQSRICSDNTCHAGTCANTSRVDMLPCSRNTAGTSCGTPIFTNCGVCTGSSENGCASDGHQTCTCIDMICVNDTCQTQSASCETNCSQRNDGELCAIDPDSCGIGDLELCCSGGTCGQPCGCRPR